MSSPRLLAAIREFTSTILDPYDLQESLHRVTDHAAALTGAQGAGIMLAGRGEGMLGFAAASDPRVVELEVIQERIEAGPCYDAFVANQLGVVEDLEQAGRWPEYELRAMQLGLRAVLAVPMNASGQTIGVINIHRDEPGPWSSDEIEAAQVISAMGAGYLRYANQTRTHHELPSQQLQAALDGYDLIVQAKATLMSRHGIDAETAFERLRRVSQEANLKLRDVARNVLGAEAASAD